MSYSKFDLGTCCCGVEEFPVCDGAYILPGTLFFTDSILGAGSGTHQVGGPHDSGFGYWEGTLTVDFAGTDAASPCGECPAVLGVEVIYRLIPAVVGFDCNFTVEIEIDVDDTQLCLVPGPFADMCQYNTTIFTPPPAFSVTGTPACAGSGYIVLVHGCANPFTITWSQ